MRVLNHGGACLFLNVSWVSVCMILCRTTTCTCHKEHVLIYMFFHLDSSVTAGIHECSPSSAVGLVHTSAVGDKLLHQVCSNQAYVGTKKRACVCVCVVCKNKRKKRRCAGQGMGRCPQSADPQHSPTSPLKAAICRGTSVSTSSLVGS